MGRGDQLDGKKAKTGCRSMSLVSCGTVNLDQSMASDLTSQPLVSRSVWVSQTLTH
eukprot:m.114674 g.114674  ORF g.114674 m.114674 type:complete len:56 (+) comp13548_c1_seq2:952-1119(+)